VSSDRPRLPRPRLVLSDSCHREIQAGCQLADRIFGPHGFLEVAWVIWGVIVEHVLYGLHPLIPRSLCSLASFSIRPEDLSALNRWAASQYPGMVPAMLAHRHPGSYRPRPSGVDERDRDVMSRLLANFNHQAVVHERPLLAAPGGEGDEFVVDRLTRDVRIVAPSATRTGDEAAGEGGAEGPQGASPPPPLLWRERIPLSYQGFVIFNRAADADAVYGEVVRVVRDRLTEDFGYGPHAQVVRDEPVEVLSDDEVVLLTGQPIERIHRPLDLERLGEEVATRIRPQRVVYSYTNNQAGRTTTSANGGSGGWEEDRDDGSPVSASPRSGGYVVDAGDRVTRPDSFTFLRDWDGAEEAAVLAAEAAEALGWDAGITEPIYLVPGRDSTDDVRQALWEACWVLRNDLRRDS